MTTLRSLPLSGKRMRCALLCAALLILCLFPGNGSTHELTGNVTAEYRPFFNEPLYPGQQRHSRSGALEVEYFHQFENGSSITFVPFARYDYDDPERTHADIRELNGLYTGDGWQIRLGIAKVFWGVTEFVHLVDIINQTDLVENINYEHKLGQPMIHLSFYRDWGDIDLFTLTGFRERTFPGKEGRLRPRLYVDTKRAEYQSDDEEKHIDFAVRYSHSIDKLDFGIYQFHGTGRDPILEPKLKENGEMTLIPYYEQIDQTGLDLQITTGQWLIKTEALFRSGRDDDFFACTGGIEYTLVGIGHSKTDVGIIWEYAYDERGDEAATAFENDLIAGLRVTLNDIDGTEILWGLAYDLDKTSKLMSVEISRRIGSRWRIALESKCFFGIPAEDTLYDLRDDDYFQAEITWYF